MRNDLLHRLRWAFEAPHRRWLATILVTGIALRVYGALHRVDVLLYKTLPDDAFYYFQIARNIAQGHGVTFDGLAPTNGFHPLWMALITPIFVLFPGDQSVNASLILSGLLDTFSAWMLYRLVKRLTGRPAPGVLAALLYFLSPMVWMFSINGLETAVNMALVSVTAERFLAFSRYRRLSLNHFALLGLLFGLALLGRTDNIFLIAGCSVSLLFLWRQLSIWRRLRGLVLAGVVTAMVTAPWFLWNYVTFGSIVQVSGLILPYLEHQLFARASGGAFPELLRHTLTLLYQGTMWTFIWAGFGRLSNTEGSIVPLALLFSVSAGLIWTDPVRRRRLGRQLVQIAFLFLYVATLFLYHQGQRWIYREWYTVPITWTLLVLVGLFYDAVVELAGQRLPDKWPVHRLVWTVLFVTLLVRSGNIWYTGIYPFQGGLIALSHMIDELPTGARVGVSDSGYVGFTANKTVINLDGVVNNQAAAAIRQGRLMAYLLENQVDYLYVQPRYMIPEFFGPDFQSHLEPAGAFQRVVQAEASAD